MRTAPFQVALAAFGADASGLCVAVATAGQRSRLPTGALKVGEAVESTCARVLARIGCNGALPLWPLAGPRWTGTDLRGAYLVLVAQAAPGTLPRLVHGVTWRPVDEALVARLSSTDRESITAARETTRWLLEHTSAATELCAEPFTIAEWRNVVEVVLNTSLDSGNFHRKHARRSGSVELVGATTRRNGGRPAELYRAAPHRHYPFCHRIDLDDLDGAAPPRPPRARQ